MRDVQTADLLKKTPFLRIPSELSMRKKGVFIFMDLCGQHFFFFLRCLIPQCAYSANQNQSDEVRQAARYQKGQSSNNAEDSLPPFHITEYEAT